MNLIKKEIIHNYISVSVFKKNNINYEEKKFVFDKNMKFSFGICSSKINKKRKRNDNIVTNHISNTTFQNNINNMVMDGFAKYFIKTELEYNTPINKFYKYITNNFLLEETSKKIYDLFFKIQKVYNILSRFFNKIKFKKLKRSNNTYDLLMIPLENYNDSLKTDIIQNGVVYTFKISDLLCIVNDNITNCCHDFFPDVKKIKNPYTNIPFELHNLYNIYFCIKKSNYIMPALFTNLFICNFNYELYSIKNESEIRDAGIINYYTNATIDELYDDFKAMQPIIKIINKSYKHHNEFPKDVLINIFRPFIRDFLITRYSLNLSSVSYHTKKLSKKLYGFFSYNSNFGRIYYKSEKKFDEKFNIKFTKNKIFDTKYVSYNNINVSNISFVSCKIERKINKLRSLEGYSVIPIVYTFSRELDNENITGLYNNVIDSSEESEKEDEEEDIINDNETLITDINNESENNVEEDDEHIELEEEDYETEEDGEEDEEDYEHEEIDSDDEEEYISCDESDDNNSC